VIADILLLVAVALVLMWVSARLRAIWVEAPVSPLARMLRGWQPDGWPRGVQEEDFDRPWGRRPPASHAPHADEELRPVPRLTPVRGSIRPR
jgi:hypothetical protein